MKKQAFLILAFVLGTLLANGQRVKWSADDVKALTPLWTGERTPDGRPKVSDNLLERLKNVQIEEAWSYLRSKGYENQFENFAGTHQNEWQILKPEKPMTGRVVTAQFMPLRPDYNDYVQRQGEKEGNLTLPVTNYAPINSLTNGDVYVADGYGKIVEGTLIGSNLGTAIYNNSQNGIIFNGSIRDSEDLIEKEGFNGWIRGTDPTGVRQMMTATINAPIRIGRVSVLPGDVVLAKKSGVIFIPSHFVAELIISGEYVSLHDQFSFFCIENKIFKYDNERFVDVTPEELEAAFIKWVDERPELLPMPRQELMDYLEKRRAEIKARRESQIPR